MDAFLNGNAHIKIKMNDCIEKAGELSPQFYFSIIHIWFNKSNTNNVYTLYDLVKAINLRALYT